MKSIFLGFLFCFVSLGSACQSESNLGELSFLNLNRDTLLNKVFDQAKKYELQIRYVKIDRDEDGNPILTPYEFRVDDSTYFYPASTVKMPVAFLALEKVNKLKAQGIPIDFKSVLEIDSVRHPQSPVRGDSTSLSGKASIGHYVHKLFTVSDNDAYNRLYEFVGPEEVNSSMTEKGLFKNSRIVHRVGISGFSPEENLYTNPFTFYKDGQVIYQQAAQKMEDVHFKKLNATSKGVAYVNSENVVVNEPFDFSQKNYVSLRDLQESLISVILQDGKFDLTQKDYDLLYKSMSIYPDESKAPVYDPDYYYDGYVKFFMFGDTKEEIPSHIRIFNKVGFAYGYLTDCAYIVDFKNKIEFFLAATIHVNENQTYNDGVYEYDDVGIPFLSKLGKAFYDYELERDRSSEPKLDRLVIDY
jgi:hypothetical protein